MAMLSQSEPEILSLNSHHTSFNHSPFIPKRNNLIISPNNPSSHFQWLSTLPFAISCHTLTLATPTSFLFSILESGNKHTHFPPLFQFLSLLSHKGTLALHVRLTADL